MNIHEKKLLPLPVAADRKKESFILWIARSLWGVVTTSERMSCGHSRQKDFCSHSLPQPWRGGKNQFFSESNHGAGSGVGSTMTHNTPLFIFCLFFEHDDVSVYNSIRFSNWFEI